MNILFIVQSADNSETKFQAVQKMLQTFIEIVPIGSYLGAYYFDSDTPELVFDLTEITDATRTSLTNVVAKKDCRGGGTDIETAVEAASNVCNFLLQNI